MVDNGFGGSPIDREQFFAPLAPKLAAFAASHNLRISKYEHASATWNFGFRLCDGSSGVIQTLRAGANDLFIAGSRELRDYEQFRRYLRRWDGPIIPRDDPGLEGVLTSLLKEIVELPTGCLACDERDYRPFGTTSRHLAHTSLRYPWRGPTRIVVPDTAASRTPNVPIKTRGSILCPTTTGEHACTCPRNS